MEIISTIPESQEHWLSLRSKDLTSTEVSALFGLNPYLTKFELWHRKKENIVVEFQANERTLWGNRLEAAIAEASAQECGWMIRKAPEYVSAPALRIGSSFDYIIQDDDKSSEEYALLMKDKLPTSMLSRIPKIDLEILEIKNVDSLVFKDGWLADDDGNLEAPPHIELQIQQQMILKPEITRTRIRALVGGNKMVEIIRERNEEIQQQILNEVAAFWKSIDENNPPDPDFSADIDTLKRLYGAAEPGKLLDAHGNEEIRDLVIEYNQLGKQVKAMEEIRDGVKGKLLTLIDDAEKVVGEGFSISAGTVGEVEVAAFVRKAFRQFRVYLKKVK